MPQDASQSVKTAYDGFDRLPVAGQWRHGRGGGVIADRDPFRDSVILEIPGVSVADLDEAYRAAARA